MIQTLKLTMNMMNITRLVAIAFLISFANLYASSAHAGNCVQSGGPNLCSAPVYTQPATYALCDDQAPAVYREVAWCNVLGGTWNAALTTCENRTVTPGAGSAGTLGLQFEKNIHGPSCVGGGPDPGPCSNVYCSCHQEFVLGLVTEDWSPTPFGDTGSVPGCGSAWAENVILEIHHPANCPTGYQSGSGGDPGLPCFKSQFCWECYMKSLSLGNPINVGNGDKIQREMDYSSPAPGGLKFERIYNSGGFFDPTTNTPDNTHFWHHTYSWKLVPYPGSSYLMAIVQRPDGTLVPFNTSGAESQNNDGAASHLATNGTGWALTTPESDVYQFDSAGKLTSMTTRSGFATTLAYDTNNRLQTVADAFGRALTLTYNGSGLLDTMSDPASHVYHYAYDSVGRMITVTYPDSSVRTYLYENTDFLWAFTGLVDERSIRISTYGYDAIGRGNFTQHTGPDNYYALSYADGPTSETVAASDGFGTALSYSFTKINGALKKTSEFNSALGTESATYDTNGNPLTKTNRRGYVTTYVYDSTRNLETSRTEASGQSVARTIATTWHSTYRLPATITEPSGVSGVNLVTTFTYDTAGNLTKKNMTAGTYVREWNYTVNARGQVLTIDGPRTDASDVTTITYFGDTDTCTGCRGQVHTVTNALSQVTTFNTYDNDGRPTQITDANGVATTLTYKTRGWLASRTTSGETTSYDYDASGNLTKVTMPDSSYITYEYDDAPSLIGIQDSLGNSIQYELDVMGNRVSEKVLDSGSVLRKSLERAYDAANRLQSDIGGASQVTTYGYDVNNNLLTVTDPLNRVTTNTYDQLDRLTNVQDAASGNTVFTYDAKDRLTSVKDPKLSNTTSYTYNGLGDLLTQVSPDTGTTTFTFDAAGNVATQTDARSTATTYTYDALNRVTAATVTDGTVMYTYDNTTVGGSYARGHLTTMTDPSGNTSYAYDSLGRITTKTQIVTASPSNKTFAVGYSYTSGRLSGITYPSGHVTAYGFDGQGRITSITVDGTTILSSAQYFPFGAAKAWTWGNSEPMMRTFDLDGRISTLTLGPAAGTYGDLSQVFGYDGLNRMTSANLAAGQTQSFTYDSNSNRTNATINAASTTYSYPSDSHKLSSLSGATTQSFTYDNAGNLTVSAGITYVYDGRGRMKQAGSVTYLINGLGQRVKKSSGSDNFFAYDESGHLIGEYDASGTPIEETVWLGDTPVAVVKPKTGGFDVFYIWSDNLGTPRMISDTTNAIRWQWDNAEPFGNNAPNENPSGLGAFSYNLRFPGQYYDAETGKHYNYYRDYDPGLGRYAESDPIGLDGGANTYAYVVNDPLGLSDPSGQNPGIAIARLCARFPSACLALVECRANPVKCKDLLCKANSAISRYKIHCMQPGCGQADSPIALVLKTSAACACLVNRVFEKYVCNGGKSDKGHDDEIEKAKTKCADCSGKCGTLL